MTMYFRNKVVHFACSTQHHQIISIHFSFLAFGVGSLPFFCLEVNESKDFHIMLFLYSDRVWVVALQLFNHAYVLRRTYNEISCAL